MGNDLIAIWEEENPTMDVGFPPNVERKKLHQPERLVLGAWDTPDSGSTWRIIQGDEFEYLLKVLRQGYNITKKAGKEDK